MCVTLIIDKKIVCTMKELLDVVPKDRVSIDGQYSPNVLAPENLHTCLCPLDVEKTAADNGYSTSRDPHDSMRHHWKPA